MRTFFILSVIFGLLVNCFAFELGEHHDHEHEHNNEHEHDHIEHEPVHNQNHDQDQDQEVREGKAEAFASDIESNFLESDNAGLAVDISRSTPVMQDDGTIKNCVEKEEFREELKKDPILECIHKSVEKCHYTYKTQFVPIQEEVCDENFVKHCTISYRKVAINETFLHCYNPLVRDCSAPETGEETCRQYYESSCTTRYVEKAPGKFVGDTSCEKLPINLCGDMSCRMVPGAEECHNKTTASVMDQPEEHCDLSPQKTCRHKTTLVPRLKPEPECTIVPKEICNIKYVNTRIERVPFKSLWCQDEEEDIETFEDKKSNSEPLPGNEPEQETELPSLPGYDSPVPSNPLEPPSRIITPVAVITEDVSFLPDVPELAIDVLETQEPITRPVVSTTSTIAPTTRAPPTSSPTTRRTIPVTQLPKTVELRPEDLQTAISEAIRQSVAISVSRALQIQEATRNSQQSLKLAIQAAVEEAVQKAVINSVRSQTASRRPQSSRDLELAVQAAVRQAVESSVVQILRSSSQTGIVMSSGMKTELNVMENLIQQAVLQAVRAAVRTAVNTAGTQAVENTRQENTFSTQAVEKAVAAAVRRAVKIALQSQSEGNKQATQIAVQQAVSQAVEMAVRMRVELSVAGETQDSVRIAVEAAIMTAVRAAVVDASKTSQATTSQMQSLANALRDSVFW